MSIELVNVVKSYGPRPILKNINLAVRMGEMFGFLGPNGAGKTTTIRLLLGLLQPDSGQVKVLGYDLADDKAGLQARARLGFLPDIARIDGSFKGQEWLDYLARLQATPTDPNYQQTLCDQLELGRADRARKVKGYSRGMRQKLAIVQALQHRPDLLILDEPTEGLDPLAKRALFNLLETTRREVGTTIFFSSHVMSEVERLCDRVALIRAGRLIAVDAIADLRDRRSRRVEIIFEGQLNEAQSSTIAQELGSLVSKADDIQREGERWRLNLRSDLNSLLAVLARYRVRDVAIEPANLEDIFLDLYTTPAEEAARPEKM